MKNDDEKYEYLLKNHFVKSFEREIYYNKEKMKVFSIESIEDHNMVWIMERVQSANVSKDWQFYFKSPIKKENFESMIEYLRVI